MATLGIEDFNSYSAGSYLSNGASGGTGFTAGWSSVNSIYINAKSGSWETNYITLNSSNSNCERTFSTSPIIEFSCQAKWSGTGNLIYFGFDAGSKQYCFVFGYSGFSQLRYNGTSSTISNPFTSGVVSNATIKVDSTKSSNNIIFSVNGVNVGTFSSVITDMSSPKIWLSMSAYGSGAQYANIQITDGSTFNPHFSRRKLL